MKSKDKEIPSVLYTDNHLLVAFKPPGLPTQGSEQARDSLEEWIKRWIREETKKTGAIFLVPIHRLDKPVGGMVLFARSSKALSRLNEMMREKKIQKRYQARIEGTLPSLEGRLEHFLIHDEFRARVVPKETAQAKQAVLNYRLIAPGLVEVELETGRYHQIRVQLAAMGCPILGDQKYGSQSQFLPEAIALENVHLELTHPVTQKSLVFSLPYPKRRVVCQ
jgi:23S rRNA pseudouridine1911/1915/1917 synthase